MKHISLTRRKEAIVDDKNYQWLNQWKWSGGGGGALWQLNS